MKLNPKKIASDLADLAGVSVESPTNEATSWSSQTSPQVSSQTFDPKSPLGGDNIFYSFLIPGAVFQDKNGDQWEILSYEWNGRVEIENRWYPSQSNANVPVADIRRSIHSWVEPVQIKVPPPVPGVIYG
jgi:hypothetical protein